MSKSSRSKGKRGEAAARNLLVDRDFTIIANTADGSEVEDIIASSPEGKVYSIEVKNNKLINVPAVRKQAMQNAAKVKLAWMMMCKIDCTSSWLVWRKGDKPTIWNEKVK